jgi:hypothetical protein
LKELREEQAVHAYLAMEISKLRADIGTLRSQQYRVNADCDVLSQSLWHFPAWEAVNVPSNERTLLRKNLDLYLQLEHAYTRMGPLVRAAGSECAFAVAGLDSIVGEAATAMDTAILGSDQEYSRIWWSSLLQVLALTASGVVIIFALPPALAKVTPWVVGLILWGGQFVTSLTWKMRRLDTDGNPGSLGPGEDKKE